MLLSRLRANPSRWLLPNKITFPPLAVGSLAASGLLGRGLPNPTTDCRMHVMRDALQGWSGWYLDSRFDSSSSSFLLLLNLSTFLSCFSSFILHSLFFLLLYPPFCSFIFTESYLLFNLTLLLTSLRKGLSQQICLLYLCDSS
ncbi:hypothetical protein J3F83DRAFT_522708 [Trichoderma novae-zelandiae]